MQSIVTNSHKFFSRLFCVYSGILHVPQQLCEIYSLYNFCSRPFLPSMENLCCNENNKNNAINCACIKNSNEGNVERVTNYVQQ